MPTVKLSPVYNGYNDNNGLPNSGGKVTVNIAGTTTPATIYTDASGTVANTNPVILDTRGLPTNPIWLPTGAVYDLSMTTSADVPLTHVYNVSGVNDASLTVSEWVNTGFTAEYISTTSFRVPADVTAYILPYMRLKIAYLTSYLYSSVVSASYATGFTTITVTNDGISVLASGIGALFYSLLSPNNTSVPLTARKVANENLIINPDMVVNIEGAGTVTTNNAYSCDGWKMTASAGLAGSLSQAQQSNAPTYDQAGRQFTVAIQTCTTVTKPTMAAGDYLTLEQNIEGILFRSIYRQAFCLRFWAYSQTAGDYSVALRSPGQAYSCVLKYTIAAASTWQYIELNVPANGASGGWVFTNASGLSIDFVVDSGTNFKTSTLSSWQSGNYLACSTQAAGATVANVGLRIVGVEIQKGTIETTWPFQPRPEPLELSLCSRYFQQMNCGMYMYGANAVTIGHTINFPVYMRAAPTITSAGVSYTSCNALSFAAINNYSAMATVTGGTNGMMNVTMTSLSLNARL